MLNLGAVGDTGLILGNQLDDHANRGVSDFDRTHRFVTSAVWNIPYGNRGHASAPQAIVNGLLGGWQLSGVFEAQTGSPFSVLMTCAAVYG